MKIRQAQTSATYILPDPGELNKRVLIRQRVDMPADNFGVEPPISGCVPGMGEGCPDQCHYLAGNRADRRRHHPLHHHSLPPGDHR
ncbi:phage protein [Escherichia coli]|nr:phage protein [Escherichia coli]